MASQDARLSKFEADFKQQQSEMTNKIDTCSKKEFQGDKPSPKRPATTGHSAIPTKTAADAKVAIQEMAENSQIWHNGTSRTRSTKTSDGLAAI
ncbi:hypothetical protein Tco_0947464 [Tanacetum coccineum]